METRKRRTWLLIALLGCLLATLLLPGCKKYPDGPLISIEPKIFRLTGEWNLGKAFVNGVNQTDSIKTIWYYFHASIEYGKSYTISWSSQNYGPDYYEHGTWEWSDDKKSVHFKYKGNGLSGLYGFPAAYPSYPGEYTVRLLRLKELELWYKWTNDNGDVIELHLVKPKKQK